MNVKKILSIVLIGAALGLLVSTVTTLVLTNKLAKSCVPVQVLAVGGCDGNGVCGVVAVTQDGQVVKGKSSYPVAGILDCRESIDE